MLGARAGRSVSKDRTNGDKMAPSILFSWVMLSIIVAVAAGTRGHNGAWFLLALIISPLLAALCLIALRHRRPSNAKAGALTAAALTADRIDYWIRRHVIHETHPSQHKLSPVKITHWAVSNWAMALSTSTAPSRPRVSLRSSNSKHRNRNRASHHDFATAPKRRRRPRSLY
jgi:hypothetical protein